MNPVKCIFSISYEPTEEAEEEEDKNIALKLFFIVINLDYEVFF